MAINRLSAHSDRLGDFLDGEIPRQIEVPGHFDLVGCHHWGTTSYPASGSGRSQLGRCSLTNQGSFKLSQGSEYREHELPSGSRGVHTLGK